MSRLIAPETVRLPVDDIRLVELSRAQPVGWWLDHSSSATCGCVAVGAPAPGCDVGEALFRLHAAEIARRI